MFDTFFLVILFVVILGYKWEGRILAQVLLSILLGFVSNYIVFKNWVYFEINKDYIFKLLSYGVPLIFYSIFYLIMFYFNRFIMAKFLSLDDVGIFSVGVQLGAFIDLLASSFNTAFFPWIYKNLSIIDNLLNNNEIKKAFTIKQRIVKIIYLYIFGLLFISILFYFIFVFLMKYILGSSFVKVIDFLFIIIMAFYFKSLYYIFSYFIVYTQRTIILTLVTGITAIFSIFLNYYFIKYFGLWGAVYSFFITFFIYFILTFIFSIKIYELPWFIFKSRK
ncbi:MAG: lipopolysaccharide biosynthesis protein [bacterium]